MTKSYEVKFTPYDKLLNTNEPGQILQVDRDPELSESVISLEGISILVTESPSATELTQELLESLLDGQIGGGGIITSLSVTGLTKVVRVVDLGCVEA